jgi:hypothetical protein
MKERKEEEHVGDRWVTQAEVQGVGELQLDKRLACGGGGVTAEVGILGMSKTNPRPPPPSGLCVWQIHPAGRLNFLICCKGWPLALQAVGGLRQGSLALWQLPARPGLTTTRGL